ncbi:uncharacterized protein LOC142236006 [Haematobia irritans]|uniref:uncharacterized protein LOC142236006 n=1 Tax=Haematobia irritans TaxID=7368 RepID=UPI003F508A8D
MTTRRSLKNKIFCAHCKKEVKENENSIECDKCSEQYHARCTNLSKSRFDYYCKHEDEEYVCHVCENNASTSSNIAKSNSSFETQLDVINMRLKKLDQLDSLSDAVNFMSSKFDEVLKGVAENKKKLEVMQRENKALKDKVSELQASVKFLNDQRVKYDCVVTGIQTADGVSAEAAVIKLASDVGVSVSQESISDAYFLKTKNDKKSIVVKLNSQKTKDKLMLVKSKLNEKDETKSVFIHEYLSRETMALLNYAKSLKNIGYRSVYAKNGRIFVKMSELSRPRQLQNMEEVDELLLQATVQNNKRKSKQLIQVEADDSDDNTYVSPTYSHCSYFNIMSINIRSLSSVSKFNKFKSLISQLPQLPSVIAIQETWFQKDLVQVYDIPGYKAVHSCRFDSYGGTSIYIRNLLPFSVMEITSEGFIDSVVLRLNDVKVNGKPMIFTSFYKSPKCGINNFFNFMESTLERYGRNPCVFVGDANIDLLEHRVFADLLNILMNFDFRNCHELVTRPQSESSIDHVYSNIEKQFFIDSIEFDLSDHNIIFCRIALKVRNGEFDNESYLVCDYERVKDSLQHKVQDLCYTGNPSIDTANLIECLGEAISSSTVTKSTKLSLRNKIAPWVNGNLKKLLLYKDRLLRLRKKNSRPDIEIRLKRISKVIKKAYRDSMNNYYADTLSDLGNDSKKTWSFLNNTLGRGRVDDICIRDSVGNPVECDQAKSEVLNTYFVESVQKVKSSIGEFPGDDLNDLGTLSTCNYRFYFSYTSIEEMHSVICGLSPTKSSGHDGIYPKVLLTCVGILTPYLVRICNDVVRTSIYPQILKIHKVIPIPKKSNAGELKDFRPISILPIIGIVFERLLHKQLYMYLSENRLLNDYQYGFRKGCGTEEAIVNVHRCICKGLDEGYRAVVGVFYDLSKAFDLVDHNLLIRKMGFYGICGKEMMLLGSYLGNRRQFVEVKGQRSSMMEVKYGVPQGSVLGPLLFSLYINDLGNLTLDGKMFIYADDICLMYPYNNESMVKLYIERDASLIFEFVRLNKLFMNTDKTQLMRFRPRFKFNNVFNISINGREITEVPIVRYLGLYLQGNLSWDRHIQYLKSKISPAIGLLYKFQYKFDRKTKLLIYQSLIQSHYCYLSIVYGYKKTTELRSLQRLQNKALKVVANLSVTHSTLNLYRIEHPTVLPIYGIHKCQMIVYIYKCLNNIGHHTIRFRRNQEVVNTRNNNLLKVAFCQSETTRQRIDHLGCKYFNDLPLNLKEIENLSVFKTSLKKYLLERIDELLI